MEKVVIGKIVDSFGLDGTVKILSSTSFSDARYQKGNIVILEGKDFKEELTVESYRKQQDLDIVKFKEITTKEEALAKKNCLLYANKDLSLLSKGSFYYSDLESCKVIDESKNELGIVKRVEEFPAQITLRVQRENKNDFFVPFIKEFIINVDIENKLIKIHCMEGML